MTRTASSSIRRDTTPVGHHEAMARWEYKCIEAQGTILQGGVRGDVEALNDAGEEGWELVSTPCDSYGNPKRYFLKRRDD